MCIFLYPSGYEDLLAHAQAKWIEKKVLGKAQRGASFLLFVSIG